MPFGGKRVLSFETRRGEQTAELIRRADGKPTVAPSMREVPVDTNDAAFRFAERLFAGEFDMVIFLTGVGTRQLANVLSTRFATEAFPEALRRLTVVARGPKPVAVLRELNVPVTVAVPEPNTWRELLTAIEGRGERHIAVQLYGRPHPDLTEALRGRGADVTEIPVYTYGLPENAAPLRDAVTQLAGEAFDVVMFTTSHQVVNLFEIAKQMGLEQEVTHGLRTSVIASIGPTTSEMLHEYGLQPDLEPSHPKLGFLVREAAEKAEEILQKRKKI